jgi:hypothetical protein
MDHMHHHASSGSGNSRWKWALLGFLAVAGFFLWAEHRAHLQGFVPYLLLAACPLMHLFHHGGHGSHGHQDGPAPTEQPSEPKTGAPS